MACGILVSRPESEPIFPALEAQSVNHWTSREVLVGVNTIPVLHTRKVKLTEFKETLASWLQWLV